MSSIRFKYVSVFRSFKVEYFQDIFAVSHEKSWNIGCYLSQISEEDYLSLAQMFEEEHHQRVCLQCFIDAVPIQSTCED